MGGVADYDANEWAARFAVLSDASRLRLVIEMHAEPDCTVRELADRAGVSENAASQSLRALRDQGWVEVERAGRTMRYRVAHDAIVHRILHDILGISHGHD